MARINQELLKRLKKRLGIGHAQVYRLINKKADETLLPPYLAVLVLAAEQDLGVSRYATETQLAAVRQAIRGQSSPIQTTSPPSIKSSSVKKKGAKQQSAKPARRRGTSVFVVHGRDERLRKGIFRFLRSVGLNPIEWREAIKLTGKPSPHVSEILDKAFQKAVGIVVLLTADDEAKLKDELIRKTDPDYEHKFRGQARPNVLFEAGMAFGHRPDNTILVQIGEVKPFSDVAGRHVLHLDNSVEKRQEFVTKLANAGCNVNFSGNDWIEEGDFTVK